MLGEHHATLVEVKGRVEEITQTANLAAITLVDGAARFDVLVPGEGPWPAAGSRIKVTGVPIRASIPTAFRPGVSRFG